MLVKSILLAFPSYVMFSFLLQLEICEYLVSATARFWWSSNPHKCNLLGKMEKLLSREEADIGFRMIDESNLALLTKSLWRLI